MKPKETEFLSINCQYKKIVIQDILLQRKMNTVFNYMVKNEIKPIEENQKKQEKVRKTRKDKEGRKFICGKCKLGYLSYPALYTHIKTKHDGKTPAGTIRGQSGKPKKRGRPKVKKSPKIYLEKEEVILFPTKLQRLVNKEQLDIMEFDIEHQEEENTILTSSFFQNRNKSITKNGICKLEIMSIADVITIFLVNLTQFVNQQSLENFEEVFNKLISFINLNYRQILKNYQQTVNYYVDYHLQLQKNQDYCLVEGPFYLPIFTLKFVNHQLTKDDELTYALFNDFCKWIYKLKLTEISLGKEKLC